VVHNLELSKESGSFEMATREEKV